MMKAVVQIKGVWVESKNNNLFVRFTQAYSFSLLFSLKS